MPLTDEQKQAIADELQGTASTGDALAEDYGVDVYDIGCAAEECGVYRCDRCGWWDDEISEGNLADPTDETICCDCAEDLED